MNAVEHLMLASVGSLWAYAVLVVSVTIDGFFPPVPSESLVVALAAVCSVHGRHVGWVLGLAACAALAGDLTAYLIGRRAGVGRWRWQRTPKAERLLAAAGAHLGRRPAAVILGARFVPVGRVFVVLTAGATRMRLRRFAPLAGVASLLWASYLVVVGTMAGALLRERPLLASLLGIAVTLVLGLVADATSRVVRARRARAAA